jgi:hypothetical protein
MSAVKPIIETDEFSERVVTKYLPPAETPLEIVDRMETMIANHAIAHMGYATTEVVDDDLAESGAICAGHKFCAMGAMYFAAGVPLENKWGHMLMEPFRDSVWSPSRDDAPANNEALSLVRDLCNEVALEMIVSGQFEKVGHLDTPDALEDLFENYYMPGDGSPTGEGYYGEGYYDLHPRHIAQLLQTVRERLA